MFTPPPSPLLVPGIVVATDNTHEEKGQQMYLTVPSIPSNARDDDYDNDSISMQAVRAAAAVMADNHQRKQQTARRTRWAILLVPAVLVLVAVTTRQALTFDVFEELDKHSEVWLGGTSLRHGQSHHKRVPQTLSLSSDLVVPSSTIFVSSVSALDSAQSGSQTASQTPSSTAVPIAQQTIPPAPNASDPPTLPIPFPVAFDAIGAGSNVTTLSCQNFFLNMTQTEPFLSCRPLSLLEQYSEAFLQSQTNLTALNTILWGTCNTTLSESTCVSNMDWFASALSSHCSTELAQNNEMATGTLLALKAYPLVRSAGCLADPMSDVYCYALAVQSSPADFALYSLPLGLGIPNTTTPSCSSCASDILAVYADALKVGNRSADGLKDTYEPAAQSAESTCGNGYAQVGVVTSAAMRGLRGDIGRDGWMVMVLGVAIGMLLLP
ncbi:hypothetical protein EW145_g7157 [Phellinidium pouzarii]|uniref:DUF7729 domain-containing protein n=1 Tax=Phellinidium pouzarii TaxID=167371 RepID=A0A4S4KN81_9AGAM|nr:hypothetical protein EW145_g7157 [Phellinidium pouzarii]